MTDLQPVSQPATQRKQVALGGPQGDFDAAYRLAGNLSMSNLLPQALFGKPNDVLVTILYGQELGLAPMQAIQSIYVVNGRPTLSGQLWAALARKAGHKVRVTDETADSCTVEVERSDDLGHPTRVTYTLTQAKIAGLAGKDVWKSHPAAMLYARAVSTACRRACPEVALGFGDESEVVNVEPERPTLAQVAAEREDRPLPADPPAPADDDEVATIVADIERDHGPAEADEVARSSWPEVRQPGTDAPVASD